MSAKPVYLSAFKAASRLQVLRDIAAKSGKTWREARAWGFHNWESACGALDQGGDSNWYCHTSEQFRNERFADDVYTAIKHEGWFTDVDGFDTARGIVGRLSHGRFIAGYTWSTNGERVYFNEVFTDIKEAARSADRAAEIFAEGNRVHDEKFQEAQRLETQVESSFDRLRECLALRNNACFTALRDEARELIETIRESRETLRTDYAAYL